MVNHQLKSNVKHFLHDIKIKRLAKYRMWTVHVVIYLPYKRHQFFTVSHVFLFTFGVVHLECLEVGNFNWEIPTSDGKWNAVLH